MVAITLDSKYSPHKERNSCQVSNLPVLNWGLGKHMWDVPVTSLSPSFLKVRFSILTKKPPSALKSTSLLQLNTLAAIFYCAATGFTKVSVLCFYTRIIPSRRFHWAVWTVVFIASGYSFASVLANVFGCNPIAMTWDISIAYGSCMNRPVFYFANAGLGIFTDFATVLIPMCAYPCCYYL